MTTKGESLVFVHVPTVTGSIWRNEGRNFNRVPQVGEYVCLGASELWYKVIVVVHCAFGEDDPAQYAAEIYTESAGVSTLSFEPQLSKR